MIEVHKLMAEMKNIIRCKIDIGLDYEMNDFFKEYENIENFHIVKNEGYYNIDVKMKDFTIFEAKNIFVDFVSFIQYSGGSFYCRNDTDKFIEYKCISFDKSLNGFYCELKFM